VLLHTAALLAWLAAAGQGPPPPSTPPVARHVERGMAAVLALEDGAAPGEWPYEGAIRLEGAIPVGFRVGGTGFVVAALAALPGLAQDAPRRAALGRGVTFLAHALAEEGMSSNAMAGVDLRLWGMITGARGLLAARAAGERGALTEEELDRAVRDYLTRLAQLEIPRNGGWSYNRPSGRLLPSPPNSYVTADVLQVFFEARAQGFEVDPAAVERALALLESQRQPTGAFLYSGTAPGRQAADHPGVGRAHARLRGHPLWPALRRPARARRPRRLPRALGRARGAPRAHRPPQAAARHRPLLLPLCPRPRRRARSSSCPRPTAPSTAPRLAEKLERVRDEETGTWNDRDFKRSAAYGTAAAALALRRPLLPPLAGWTADE
jgi:hypothetical protein